MMLKCLVAALCVVFSMVGRTEVLARVADLPTRPGVQVRVLALAPAAPRAAVILLAGGHGGVQIFPGGSLGRLGGNFLLRSRDRFAAHDLFTVVVDAPSDRVRSGFLAGFRHTDEHAKDLAAVITWVRSQSQLPVWLVGTSRGTESAAAAGLKLQGMPGLQGVVLTSTILVDPGTKAVPGLPLDQLRLPVLVVHHERDMCRVTRFADLQRLTDALAQQTPHRVLVVRGGVSEGSDCEGLSHHGFNGIEEEVVGQIAKWVLDRSAK